MMKKEIKNIKYHFYFSNFVHGSFMHSKKGRKGKEKKMTYVFLVLQFPLD
jgi:hypothetical protein